MFTKSHSWTMRPKLVFKLVILSLLKSKPIGKERAEILFLYRIFKKFDFTRNNFSYIFQIFFSGNNITPPPRGRKRKNLASMPIPSPPVMQMMEEDDQNEEIVLDGIDPTTAAMPANVQNRYFMRFFFFRTKKSFPFPAK